MNGYDDDDQHHTPTNFDDNRNEHQLPHSTIHRQGLISSSTQV